MSDPSAVPRSSLRDLVASDLRAMAELKGAPDPSRAGLLDIMTLPATWSGIIVRLATWAHGRNLRPMSRALYFLNATMFSCEIQPGTVIGPGFAMAHHVGVGFASGAQIGANCRVMALARVGGMATDDPDVDGFPVIGDDCWLLDGAKIFGPVVVGDNVVVAASSVVTSSFPDGNVLLAGIPARVIRERPPLDHLPDS